MPLLPAIFASANSLSTMQRHVWDPLNPWAADRYVIKVVFAVSQIAGLRLSRDGQRLAHMSGFPQSGPRVRWGEAGATSAELKPLYLGKLSVPRSDTVRRMRGHSPPICSRASVVGAYSRDRLPQSCKPACHSSQMTEASCNFGSPTTTLRALKDRRATSRVILAKEIVGLVSWTVSASA
ncbi:hypothetical protein CC86DRAFT_456248 [Ophiobolus disseminans]|uniref:Uncharacterized protein n=1 Tax=Ophiobolus disseminans TaxID=1469910 RepID=A0A6A6ZYZ4_9PLEO|nr:hypothetical protein CC86DRAFT_456248 [Ophiobolus disseminans]